MKTLFLNLTRLLLGAWVGAAAIFVVTAVHEVQSPKFSSIEKAQLAQLRFPTYYQFGFALVAAAAVCAVIAVGHPAISKRRAMLFFLLIAAALGLMVYDYFEIFTPLAVMLQAEESGAARPENFLSYHEKSKMINTIDVGLCLVAALILCLPEPKSQS